MSQKDETPAEAGASHPMSEQRGESTTAVPFQHSAPNGDRRAHDAVVTEAWLRDISVDEAEALLGGDDRPRQQSGPATRATGDAFLDWHYGHNTSRQPARAAAQHAAATSTTALDRVTDALRAHGRIVKLTHSGDRAQVQCPAHDDRNPSLSVRQIDGQVLMKCHAGCENTAIVDALDLTMADLFDNRRDRIYSYPDGRRVHRSPEKRFRQSGNRKGRALYGGDRIIGTPSVYVVEGEKDVDAIEAEGGVAVCSAMGAGKAHLADWTPLTDLDVVIVADKDDAGREHAAEVEKILRENDITSQVRIVEAAVGKDAADHIAAGKTLREFVEYQPPTLLHGIVDGAWLDAQQFPELEYAVPGVIPEGLGFLAGPPKLGKSWLVADVGLACAAGGKALGHIDVTRRPVLYLALEDGHRRLQSRFRRLTAGRPIPKGINVIIKAKPDEVIPMITEFLSKHAAEKPLIILDTFGKVKPPKRAGEESYIVDYTIGTKLKDAIDAVPGSTLLVVHHTRKAESADFVDAMSGTQGIAGSADFVMVLKRKRHDDDAVLSVTGRDITEAEYALHAVDGMLWRLAGDDLAAAADAAQRRREADQLARWGRPQPRGAVVRQQQHGDDRERHRGSSADGREGRRRRSGASRQGRSYPQGEARRLRA